MQDTSKPVLKCLLLEYSTIRTKEQVDQLRAAKIKIFSQTLDKLARRYCVWKYQVRDPPSDQVPWLWFHCSSGVRFPARVGSFYALHPDQTGSGAHPTSCPRGPGHFSLSVKQPGREADHSSSSSSCVKVKNVSTWTSTPPYVFIAWCFIKQQMHLYAVVLS
jgi:hypothetical protein